VGYWYLRQGDVQNAADVAAFSAAVRLNRGENSASMNAVALQVARESGLDTASGTVEVHHPPISGASVGDATKVEVVLKENVSRYFTAIYASDKVRVSGRAVAETSRVEVCALALNTSAASALAVKGSASASFSNCVVASNSRSTSSVDMQGSAKFTGDCIYAAGGFTQGGSSQVQMTKCKGVETKSPATPDPYANVVAPTSGTSCVSGNIGSNNVNTTITPTLVHSTGVRFIRYCSLSTQGHVTFQPGLYIVDGSFSSTGQSISGTGVTFAVGGNVNLSGNLILTLSAPTSGAFSGLAFFGDRDVSIETNKISGTSGSVVQGAVYFPTGDLEYSGSSAATNGCTQLIANTIAFNGTSAVRSSCANAGTRTLSKGSSVALSE
jgi:hypothetical protein